MQTSYHWSIPFPAVPVQTFFRVPRDNVLRRLGAETAGSGEVIPKFFWLLENSAFRLRGWFASQTSPFIRMVGVLTIMNSYFRSISIPRLYATNAQVSAVSSINFVIDFPAPCPALVSMRISTGAGPA